VISNTTITVPDPWLSTKVRVSKYLRMEAAQDRNAMAMFIHGRFTERYVSPLKAVQPGEENGFLIMASSCLLIEALMAYRNGWRTTRGKSERAFSDFFARESRFQEFRDCSDFYEGVRCGILHRGETDHGWRLNFTDRRSPLLEIAKKRINCFLFLEGMEIELGVYREELCGSDWKANIWENFRNKMQYTIKDCSE
jgi:hypothetical protein